MNDKIWLVGAGYMGCEYVKVLAALKLPYTVIGRGEETAAACEAKTGCTVVHGGLKAFLETHPEPAGKAIVTSHADALASHTLALITHGVKDILVEKPGALSRKELERVMQAATAAGASVYIGYNRRCFASVQKAKELIVEDGGITSFCFEFTELGRQIAGLAHKPCIKERWFLANSTHVVDLAFHLGGEPMRLESITSGSCAWHPSAAIFAGSGVTGTGALFSYMSNWESAGRWGLEICTKERRLIFRPMEKLQVQMIGTFIADFVELDDRLDTAFKPGLYLQVEKFVRGPRTDLCTLEEQMRRLAFYNKIANYTD